MNIREKLARELHCLQVESAKINCNAEGGIII